MALLQLVPVGRVIKQRDPTGCHPSMPHTSRPTQQVLYGCSRNQDPVSLLRLQTAPELLNHGTVSRNHSGLKSHRESRLRSPRGAAHTQGCGLRASQVRRKPSQPSLDFDPGLALFCAAFRIRCGRPLKKKALKNPPNSTIVLKNLNSFVFTDSE